MPPSIEALERRLQQRKQDTVEVIARRMKEARNEMSHKDEFDIVIINDHFDTALAELGSVLDGLQCAIPEPGKTNINN
jgi:guanylate kinase